MLIILLIGLIILVILMPEIRVIIANPIKVIYNAIVDIYKYIRYKKWNICNEYGYIDSYIGYFGSGKTLSAVKRVADIYKRYNNKKVYMGGKWTLQEVHIISNVELVGIPYEKLIDCEQIVNCHNNLGDNDVVIVLLDEASTQFNSRNYKNNISSTLLNAMLTCRHHKFSMILTAQRFNQIDALIRQVSRNVIECSKIWRLQRQYKASAWDYENAKDICLIKTKKSCWFVRNRDYNRYDTSAIVDDIKRKQRNGQLLTDNEVLMNEGEIIGDINAVKNRSRRLKKIQK